MRLWLVAEFEAQVFEGVAQEFFGGFENLCVIRAESADDARKEAATRHRRYQSQDAYIVDGEVVRGGYEHMGVRAVRPLGQAVENSEILLDADYAFPSEAAFRQFLEDDDQIPYLVINPASRP